MSRLLKNQLQFEFGIIPTNINKDRKAEYIESLIATRENDDIELFRNFIFDDNKVTIMQSLSSKVQDEVRERYQFYKYQ